MFCFPAKQQGKDCFFVVFVVVWLYVFGGLCASVSHIEGKATSKDKIFGVLGKSMCTYTDF